MCDGENLYHCNEKAIHVVLGGVYDLRTDLVSGKDLTVKDEAIYENKTGFLLDDAYINFKYRKWIY